MAGALSIALDGAVLVMLGVATFYAVRLSSQFKHLKADRKVIEAMTQSLNTAAARAETAVRSMRETATSAGEDLQSKINAGRAIFDELEIIVEAGDTLAERLTGLAEKSGKNVTGDRGRPEPDTPEDGTPPRTRAERELQDALKGRQKS